MFLHSHCTYLCTKNPFNKQNFPPLITHLLSILPVPPKGAYGTGAGYGSGAGGMYGPGTNHGTGPGGNSLEKVRNTQMPASIPSRQPPHWILNSNGAMASSRAGSNAVLLVAVLVSVLPRWTATRWSGLVTTLASSCSLMIYSLLMLLTVT